MKIRNKIAAAFTAAALMFTMTDPAALGGMLNAASTAFAAIPVSQIELSSSKPLSFPVADQPLWDSGAISVNGGQVSSRDTKVEWYREDGTRETGAIADYNEKYYVILKLRLDQGYEATSSVMLYYYTEDDIVNAKYVEMVKDGDYLCGTIKFDSRTALPNAEQAVFPVSATTDGTSNRTTLTNLSVYTNKNNILDNLPKFAKILTGTSSHRGDPIEKVPITWTNDAGNFIYEKGTFSEGDVNGQEFTLIGSVSMDGYSQYINNPAASFNLYCTVKIPAADQLLPPEPRDDTPAGEYTENMTVYLTTTEGTIYYTVSESKDGANPVGGNASHKYTNGIPLAGVEGDTKTFYIKALSYDPKKLTSEIATYIYTITLEPSSLMNIPEVHLVIDPPVGGQPLDTTADYDPEPRGVAVKSAVAWIGSVVNGRADYNSSYSVSVQLTPKNMYAFNKTQAYVNGSLANCSTNESGTLTVTYTFPGRTDKLALYRIIPPSDTVVVENGTAIATIGDRLPTMADVEAPAGTVLENQYPIKWDLNTSNPLYDPKRAQSQTFTLTGKVSLPDFITYKEGENEVKVNVFVGSAGALAWPTASPSDSTQGHMFYDDMYVTLTASEGATVYYTIGVNKEAEVPTVSGGTAYTSPILLTGQPGDVVTYYIRAIAVAPGKNDSPVNSFVYTITLPKRTVDTPTANYESGTYQQSLDIALNTTTVGAEIYYTTDPTASLVEYQKYTGVFRLAGQANASKKYTVKFYAADPKGKMISSSVVQKTYTITLPKNQALAPYPDKAAGVSYENAISITLKCDSPNTQIYYTINGTDPSAASNGILYSKPILLQRRANSIVKYQIRTYAKSSDLNVDDSPVVTYNYTIGLDYGVEKIEIEQRPSKYSYYLGERLNVSGGRIKVTYDDGKTESIPMDEDMIDDFDSWVTGQQTLTVYYKGRTAEFNIVVRSKSSSSDDSSSTDSGKKDDTSTTKPDDTTKDDTKTDTPTDSTTVSDPTMEGSALKGWTNLQKKLKSAERGSRVKIYLNGTTLVPADIINTAIGRKLTLEFAVNSNVSWVIDTGKLKKTVASFSAGIKTTDIYIPAVLIDNAGGEQVMKIHTYGENKIGAMLYVNTGSKVKNRFANMFRYNENTEKLDFVSTSKVSTSTGIATLKPSLGGDYVIMLDTQTKLPGDADNSTTIDARDAAAILKQIVTGNEIDDSWDYNGDGFVNAIDSAMILKAVVGVNK